MATTTETAVEFCVLRIDNFSSTKDKTASRTFRVGGHSWRVECYPCGDDGGWVSLSLLLVHPSPVDRVSAEWTYALVDGQPPLPRSRLELDTFTSAEHCVRSDFVERAKLHLRGDCFRVLKEFPGVPPPQLHQHLGELLASRVAADVVVEVFMAHRYVLAARSSALRAQLFGGKEQGSMAHVSVAHVAPAVFKALLHFIYTDELVEGGETMVQDLLVAGTTMYGVESLPRICEEVLYQRVDESTAATTPRSTVAAS